MTPHHSLGASVMAGVLLIVVAGAPPARAQSPCAGLPLPCGSAPCACGLPGAALELPTFAPPAPVTVPPAELREPPQDQEGLDVASLPERFPEGRWLPLTDGVAPLLVEGRVNGVSTELQLDTGATSFIVGADHAARLHLRPDAERHGTVELEAFGRVLEAPRAAATVQLGAVSFDVQVAVIDGDQPFLVGYQALAQLDLYVAIDEQVVGIFDAGAGPLPAEAVAVPLLATPAGVPEVVVGATGRRARFTFDTGAAGCLLPESWIGGLARVGGYRSQSIHGAGEVSLVDAGPWVVGALEVGEVFAGVSGGETGTVGLDVVGRYQVLISARRGYAFFGQRDRLPPGRTLGQRGAPCSRDGRATSCIAVTLAPSPQGAWPRLCATLGPAAPRGALALDVRASHAEGATAWGGGTATLHVAGGTGWRTRCMALRIEGERWAAAELELMRVRRAPAGLCNAEVCLERSTPLP